MKLKNRLFRLTTALAITGIVAAQIPSRPSVSLAADNYPGGSRSLFSKDGAGTLIVGSLLVYSLYTAIASGKFGRTGDTNPLPPAAGGGEGGGESVYEVAENKSDDFSSIAKIIRNADDVDKYSKGSFTGFCPTNDALTEALGADTAMSLQDPANQDKAKQFLASITVAGNYNIQRLKETASQGKAVKTLSGETINLKLEGDTLTANGVEVLATEYPATNGWVLATNGVVASTQK